MIRDHDIVTKVLRLEANPNFASNCVFSSVLVKPTCKAVSNPEALSGSCIDAAHFERITIQNVDMLSHGFHREFLQLLLAETICSHQYHESIPDDLYPD